MKLFLDKEFLSTFNSVISVNSIKNAISLIRVKTV